jgi:hypothetical protein
MRLKQLQMPPKISSKTLPPHRQRAVGTAARRRASSGCLGRACPTPWRVRTGCMLSSQYELHGPRILCHPALQLGPTIADAHLDVWPGDARTVSRLLGNNRV